MRYQGQPMVSGGESRPEADRPRGEGSCAVLVSGGVESSVLVAELGREFRKVYPIYVRQGLAWEEVEEARLRRFLAAIGARGPAGTSGGEGASVADLVELALPMGDVYEEHWSITGRNVPDAASRDEAVYLPGRNLLLLVKAALWCHLHGVEVLALGALGTNPFPDSTPDFYRDFETTFNRAVAGRIRVLRPFAALAKVDVIRRGRELPLELTFSCMAPAGGEHCGRCNKCEERRQGFRAAGVADRTVYASQ